MRCWLQEGVRCVAGGTDQFDKRGLCALTTAAMERPKHQKHVREGAAMLTVT